MQQQSDMVVPFLQLCPSGKQNISGWKKHIYHIVHFSSWLHF